MRLCYLLLSPTFGMHQYTADLANRTAVSHDVHLVTTARAPRDRYAPAVTIHKPLSVPDTGLSIASMRVAELRRLADLLRHLGPDVVHLTGPHLWNVLLVAWLRRNAIPVIHTIHDLDPHAGAGYGSLLHLWNGLILRMADHILVHGERYRNRLLARGLPPHRVTYTPLLHLFLSYEEEAALRSTEAGQEVGAGKRDAEVEGAPMALFFGRLRSYKGVDTLLAAWERLSGRRADARLVLAGQGRLPPAWRRQLPSRVAWRNRRVENAESVDLFRSCDLLVLPYVDASQSALVAAAYYFRRPVIVTRSGALPEYVLDGRTGYIVTPGDVAALTRTLERALTERKTLRQMGMAGRAWYEQSRRREWATLAALYRNVTFS